MRSEALADAKGFASKIAIRPPTHPTKRIAAHFHEPRKARQPVSSPYLGEASPTSGMASTPPSPGSRPPPLDRLPPRFPNRGTHTHLRPNPQDRNAPHRSSHRTGCTADAAPCTTSAPARSPRSPRLPGDSKRVAADWYEHSKGPHRGPFARLREVGRSNVVPTGQNPEVPRVAAACPRCGFPDGRFLSSGVIRCAKCDPHAGVRESRRL